MKKVILLFLVPLCLGVTGMKSCAPVPQTGQTTCWDSTGTPIGCAGTGQDGDLQAGVMLPIPRFVDLGDGTIKDKLTGLIWLKDANCFGTRTWAQALTDANTLNSGECSLTDGSVEGDWYLPNVRELYSLVDFEEDPGPVLPTPNPFMNFQSDNYWSSTTRATEIITNDGYIVRFSRGEVVGFNKTATALVIPVREHL